MEFGSKEKMESNLTVADLEQCVCPAGYTGLSCESCDYSYVRLPSESSYDHFICSLCDCNKHSPSCDETTGQCDVSKQCLGLIY